MTAKRDWRETLRIIDMVVIHVCMAILPLGIIVLWIAGLWSWWLVVSFATCVLFWISRIWRVTRQGDAP